MTRRVRTPDELRSVSQHLYYEVAMVHETARALSGSGLDARGATWSVIGNALLESFAVHARALDDFFRVGPRLKPDDVVAEDFVGEVVAKRLRALLDADLRFDPVRERVNKDVAHLTYARTERGPASKQWNAAEILAALDEVWAEFAKHVRRETVDNATWVDLVEPVASRQVGAGRSEPTPCLQIPLESGTLTMSNTISIRLLGWRNRAPGGA